MELFKGLENTSRARFPVAYSIYGDWARIVVAMNDHMGDRPAEKRSGHNVAIIA
jgi:hypothetical protein